MIGAITYSAEQSRDEAARLLRFIAGEPYRPLKLALHRAMTRVAPHLNLSEGRLRHMWYGDRRIRSEEIDALRAAAEERRRKVEAGRDAAKDIATGYREIAERLRSVDEDFYRVEIGRLERQAHDICPLDRAGASPDRLDRLPASPDGGGK